MVSAVYGIPPDADAGGLAVPGAGNLPNSLISKSSRTGNDAHLARLVNVAGHDADFALVGSDDTRTIGTDQACVGSGQARLDLGHVANGDALGDGDDEGNLRIDGLHNRIGGEGRRHEDSGGVSPLLPDCFLYGIVYGDAILKFLPALSGGNAGHDVGTVLDALRRVKTAGAAGDALDDYSCILVY